MTRLEYMEYIQNVYNIDDKAVDRAICAVTGMTPKEAANIDDSDPDEGWFANFKTSELKDIYEELINQHDNASYIELNLTEEEARIIYDALEDIASSRGDRIAKIAALLLNRL